MGDLDFQRVLERIEDKLDKTRDSVIRVEAAMHQHEQHRQEVSAKLADLESRIEPLEAAHDQRGGVSEYKARMAATAITAATIMGVIFAAPAALFYLTKGGP